MTALTLDRFKLRCWARARLYYEGELALQDAVDVMQVLALECEIDQDIAQQIMADAITNAVPVS
jgi:hypothetical protein